MNLSEPAGAHEQTEVAGHQGALAAAWGMIGLLLVVGYRVEPAMPAYLWAWTLLGLIFLLIKSIVVAQAGPRQLAELGALRLLGFVFVWPGMDMQPFLVAARRSASRAADTNDANHGTSNADLARQRDFRRRAARALRDGTLNIVAGIVLFWSLGLPLVRANSYVFAAVGLAAGGLSVLYGIFAWLAALWRWAGVEVERQWTFLPGSRSLADYWSLRWNRAFHDFVRQEVYFPLRQSLGNVWALLGSFLFSGLLHDAFISVQARGGYGLPTMYFLIQAIGIWFERRWLGSSRYRRLWAATFVLLPIGLLFHRPFIERVIIPQLVALRGVGPLR